MAAMQTVSARIPGEDLEWLATFDIQGATTPSDKLRALVTQIRRQHEGSLDYSSSLQWMRDLVSPFVTAVGSFEHRQGRHSEVLRLVNDWVPQVMAILVAEGTLARDPQRKALELEEKLVAKLFQLVMAILRLGVTPSADCYDPKVLEKHLPQLIELTGVIAASRRLVSTDGETKHG
jgi:hypothetical protein